MYRMSTNPPAFAVLALLLFISDVAALSSSAKPKFFGGAGVGRLNLEDVSSLKIACLYDMVLVERIQGRPRTESGLFVPQEDLPKLHLCKGEFTYVYCWMIEFVLNYVNKFSLIQPSLTDEIPNVTTLFDQNL